MAMRRWIWIEQRSGKVRWITMRRKGAVKPQRSVSGPFAFSPLYGYPISLASCRCLLCCIRRTKNRHVPEASSAKAFKSRAVCPPAANSPSHRSPARPPASPHPRASRPASSTYSPLASASRWPRDFTFSSGTEAEVNLDCLPSQSGQIFWYPLYYVYSGFFTPSNTNAEYTISQDNGLSATNDRLVCLG